MKKIFSIGLTNFNSDVTMNSEELGVTNGKKWFLTIDLYQGRYTTVIVYCKKSEHNVYLVAANIIAAQILKKPESVLGVMNCSEETSGIRAILIEWAQNGHIDFSKASLIEYQEDDSYLEDVDVDLLFIEMSDKEAGIRGYGAYQTCKEAESVLVVASGEQQAQNVKEIFETSVLSENPMAVLKEHKNLMLVGDWGALAKRSKIGIWYD